MNISKVSLNLRKTIKRGWNDYKHHVIIIEAMQIIGFIYT